MFFSQRPFFKDPVFLQSLQISHDSNDLRAKYLNQIPYLLWILCPLLCNDTGLTAVNTGNHKYIFNSFQRCEIQALMANSTYEGRERGQGKSFQGKVEMNIICYLKLGCSTPPGMRMMEWAGERNMDIIKHCL